ncbi:hypothetical protein GCM10009565_12610 [Amycolatopsis albidoflavus]
MPGGGTGVEALALALPLPLGGALSVPDAGAFAMLVGLPHAAAIVSTSAAPASRVVPISFVEYLMIPGRIDRPEGLHAIFTGLASTPIPARPAARQAEPATKSRAHASDTSARAAAW